MSNLLLSRLRWLRPPPRPHLAKISHRHFATSSTPSAPNFKQTHYGNSDTRRGPFQKILNVDQHQMWQPPGFRFKGQGIKRTWVDNDARLKVENPYANKALSKEEAKQFGYISTLKNNFRGDRSHFAVRGKYRYLYDSRGRWVGDRFFRYMHYKQNSKFNIFKYYPFNLPDMFAILMLAFWGCVFLGISNGIWFELSDYNFNSQIESSQDHDFKEYTKVICNEVKFSNFTSRLYSVLPWQTFSRMWGWLMSAEWWGPGSWIFVWMFIKLSGANIEEAYIKNFKEYKSVNDFFRRQLEPGLRPVDSFAKMVSPSDGKILNWGKIDKENNYKISQVKGLDYSLKGVLGPNPMSKYSSGSGKNLVESDVTFTELGNEEYAKSLLRDSENNSLFYAVVYLAPKDYHRFHSPVNWKCEERRHFPGDLFSVHPKIVNWLNYLYVLNERVVLNGTWEHGFFSFIAVGATNVGSTKIYFDEQVLTNKPYHNTEAHKHKGYYFDRNYEIPVDLEKGEQIGEFNMGSTVVLVFEAPKSFEFKLEKDQKMLVGSSIVNFCPDLPKKVVEKTLNNETESLTDKLEIGTGKAESDSPIKKPKRFWFF